MAKYAASPEDLRKTELARMSPDQRDKLVEKTGLDRWKKASKAKPEVTSNPHFFLFSTLAKERATATLKALETQYTAVRPILGAKVGGWGEKVSIFVFPNAASYVEFVRAMENREIESGDVGTAKLSIPQPYLAMIDPTGGRDEPATTTSSPSGKRPARGKKSDDEFPGGERGLASLLKEQFVIGMAESMGKPPRWLSRGLGSFLVSRSEPHSGAFKKLRSEARSLFERGWASKASEALGDQAKTEEVRAVGFAFFEWMNAQDRGVIPEFTQAMLEGGEKLDDVLGNVLNMSRQQFLQLSGEFVASNYGNVR